MYKYDETIKFSDLFQKTMNLFIFFSTGFREKTMLYVWIVSLNDPGSNFHLSAPGFAGALLEGEVGGDGLLSRNGSPGTTKATIFSFLDSQKAG